MSKQFSAMLFTFLLLLIVSVPAFALQSAVSESSSMPIANVLSTEEFISRYDACLNLMDSIQHTSPYFYNTNGHDVLFYDNMLLFFNSDHQIFLYTITFDLNDLEQEDFKKELVAFFKAMTMDVVLQRSLADNEDDLRKLNAWTSLELDLYPQLVKEIVSGASDTEELRRLLLLESDKIKIEIKQPSPNNARYGLSIVRSDVPIY